MTDRLFKKVATLTDIHFGRSSNSPMCNQDNLDFIEWFIDKAKTAGCETAIMMGDWHDNRHSLHVSTMDYSMRGIEMLNGAFEKVYWIPGNHDLLYRDKRDVASIAFAKYLQNIQIIREPLTVGEVTILPWLVKEEHKKIKRLKSRYIFGHLELNGFLMNARVPMPDHPDGLGSDDFKNNEYVFSGHFHFRQAKDNVVYTGNVYPFNFADAWDNDRGMMILEWGKEPIFESWKDSPQYRTMTLSELLHNPDKMLCPKLTARVTLDMDISFEEAQVIRDEYLRQYGIRKIELIHQSTKTSLDQTFTEGVNFQSVDQIVIDGLLSVQSEQFSPNKLVEIYRSLGGTATR